MQLCRIYKKKITLDREYIYVTSCGGGRNPYTEYIVVEEETNKMYCVTVHNEGLIQRRLLAENVTLEWTAEQLKKAERYARK